VGPYRHDPAACMVSGIDRFAEPIQTKPNRKSWCVRAFAEVAGPCLRPTRQGKKRQGMATTERRPGPRVAAAAVPQDGYERINRVASAQYTNHSSVVRRFVMDGLEKAERQLERRQAREARAAAKVESRL